jgi:hypothetical protein
MIYLSLLLKIKRLKSVIRQRWYNGDRVKDKVLLTSEQELPESIYPSKGVKSKEFYKNWNFAHFTLKYTIFLPALQIFDIFFGKRLIDKVPNDWINKNLYINNLAIEKAIKLMQEKHNQKWNPWEYHLVRKVLNTLVFWDGFTKVFFDYYMHEVAREMVKEYKGKEVHTVAYTDIGAYNPVYFTLAKVMLETGELPKSPPEPKKDLKLRKNVMKALKDSKNTNGKYKYTHKLVKVFDLKNLEKCLKE